MISLALAAAARAEDGGGTDDGALAELSELARAHPEDPDLVWLWIDALEEAGRNEEAALALEGFLARFGDWRPEARLRLGRLLYQLGRHEAALAALERAALSETRASCHFYRGLALRALARHREAKRAFRLAARLDPALVPEALLLAALSHLRLGEDAQGRALLREVLERAPATEAARQAEILIGGARAVEVPSERRLQLFAQGGVEFDSNVTLEGDETPDGSASDEDDARAVWSAGLAYRLHQSEETRVVLGYRYSESAHRDLHAYDLREHALFGSGLFSLFSRTTLRMDAVLSDSHLDDDRYQRSWLLRPNLLYAFGERIGVSRLYLELEAIADHEDPPLESLVRDGRTWALALEHYASIPDWRGAWARLAVRASRQDTEAEPSEDVLGFGGAYDHRRLEGSARFVLPLRAQLMSELELSFGRVGYANRNVIDALFESGPAAAERRSDTVIEASFALRRPLSEHAELELRWQGIRQRSNVEAYSYARNIVGLYFRTRMN